MVFENVQRGIFGDKLIPKTFLRASIRMNLSKNYLLEPNIVSRFSERLSSTPCNDTNEQQEFLVKKLLTRFNGFWSLR